MSKLWPSSVQGDWILVDIMHETASVALLALGVCAMMDRSRQMATSKQSLMQSDLVRQWLQGQIRTTLFPRRPSARWRSGVIGRQGYEYANWARHIVSFAG